MQAIETRYYGPTNTRGSVIVARLPTGFKVTIPYPHELSGEFVFRKAAETLCKRMGWVGELIGGETATGYVFVFANGTTQTEKRSG